LEKLAEARRAGDPYNVVLIDHALTDTDPLVLGERIRKDASLDGTALVIVLPGSHRADAQRFQDAGFHGCLLKPLLRPRLLQETLTRVLALDAPPPGRDPAASVVADATSSGVSKMKGPARFLTAAAPRILLAEDNLTNQIYARCLLERIGCKVDVAANGREAVDRVRAQAYDLVLMDCQMPLLNGYDATSEIRRMETPGRRVPIVALTANALPGEWDRCLAAGMDGHLSKPFRREEMERTLARWIAPRQEPA
jgi:CheY-like chemotaxis protein